MVMVNFEKIEKKWQNKWNKNKVFEVNEKSMKEKYYVLEMFPYPSGEGLHMGHAWNYIIGDILARFKIMRGFNVLHPMGYDALGLPAENAAIKEGILPEKYTNDSIKNFVKQQKMIGLSYDWSRIVNTSSSNYYKWDQWIFLKMFEKGLAYQKEASVNWCPDCNTVLANEQVVDGKCWRHDETNVKVKKLRQWFFRITNYSQKLLDGIENLKEWPERTILMQKNWIGKSYGTEIDFKIGGEKWPIFTTRPDTIFGVTFMVISAQHPKLDSLITKEQRKEVDKFLKKLSSVSKKDLVDTGKIGAFTGNYAINPINNEKIPIYIGNFVVADYGSGIVMAVPAHDQRDFEFAKKYKIKIKQVISGGNLKKEAYVGEGHLINSGKFDDLSNFEAKEKITKFLIKKKLGKKVINFKLRDWGISRQRYWGTPIPIIYCDDCGIIKVPEKDLPVILPKKINFKKGNPLKTATTWINVKCPECGGKGKRETDTMDTFVNSSWYFLRYCDPNNSDKIFDEKKGAYWCPIDTYIGGAEHSCMHLIYFRFYTKFLRDIGLIKFDEPAKRLFHQGIVHGENGLKMSKSKGNGVLPEIVSKKYGIDTARFFMCGLASPDKDITWSEKGINGSLRFIKKIMEILDKLKIGNDPLKVEHLLNKTIIEVSNDIETFNYRAATIRLKALFDLLFEQKEISRDTLEKSLKLLNPFCPHITEELWEKCGNKDFISTSEWPKSNEKKIIKEDLKKVDLNEKYLLYVKRLLDKSKLRPKKIYLYVMPFELDKIEVAKIRKLVETEVGVFSTGDIKKYDPENRSKKARPGLPGVYFE